MDYNKCWRYFKKKIGLDEIFDSLDIDSSGKREFKKIYLDSIKYGEN